VVNHGKRFAAFFHWFGESTFIRPTGKKCLQGKYRWNQKIQQIWLVVSTHLKNMSQNGNLPQSSGCKKNMFETTS